MKPSRDTMARLLLPVLTGCLLLAAWVGIKAAWQLHDFIIPAPQDVVLAFLREAGPLGRGAMVTFLGALMGFAGAVILGFFLSVAMAAFRFLRYGLYPFVIFMQMIPILATAAIVVIFLDVGLPSVALIAFLIGFFPVVASTLHGLLSVPEEPLEMFRLYQASPWQELFLLRVPHSLPSFFTGAKIAATLAVIGSVTGEIFAGSSSGTGGLGFLIMIYKAELEIAALYAATLLCCLLGFVFVGLVLLCRHLALRHWHESARPGLD